MGIITNPDLVSESLIPVGKAGKYFPVPISRPSVERMMRTGKNGIRLESIMIGGQSNSNQIVPHGPT